MMLAMAERSGLAFLILILIPWCSLACAGSGELDPDATRVPVKETRLYVRDVGAGEPLVVPGAAWLGLDLGPLEATFRVIAYDPRGRGRSASVAAETLLGLEDDVADLEELRSGLDLDRISLLGWAYNGGLAVRYALAHPEHTERLVLVAPLSPRRTPYYEQTTQRFRLRADPQLFQGLQEMRTTGAKDRDPGAYCRAVTAAFLATYSADTSIGERMRSNPCALPNLDPDISAQLGQTAVQGLGDWDWRPELAGLDVPVLLVHGTHDIVPIESTREYMLVLPDARILELEGVGHFPWLETPEQFFPTVIDFLNTKP
jgi:proline iminopeptidase